MSDDVTYHPLSDAEFDQLLALCGSFEPGPLLAVAVSGGPDSMALCLLANRWARSRGGKIVALTVDHNLRPESTREAATVGEWLRAQGIEHHILPWKGVKPTGAIQQAARAARYRLLGEWCAAQGILHLLVAHHLEDQAETYALRLGRGSGVEGLAGMPLVGRLPEHLADAPLLLRPLLAVPKGRLVNLLEAEGQPWVNDPSNDLDKFERVRIRRLFAEKDPEGLTIDAAIKAVGGMQDQKAGGEVEVVRFLGLHVFVDPAGFASFDRAGFCRMPQDIALRCLARIIMVMGGRVYPPRSDRLATLMAAIRGGKSGGWTLSGCLFEADEAMISVFRESSNCSAMVLFDAAGDEILWDNRFRVGFRSESGAGVLPEKVSVGKLDYSGWCDALANAPSLRDVKIPFRAKLSLPAFFQGERLLAVPLLGGYQVDGEWGAGKFFSIFDPTRSLSV